MKSLLCDDFHTNLCRPRLWIATVWPDFGKGIYKRFHF